MYKSSHRSDHTVARWNPWLLITDFPSQYFSFSKINCEMCVGLFGLSLIEDDTVKTKSELHVEMWFGREIRHFVAKSTPLSVLPLQHPATKTLE
jgi:hypothetical protein